MDDGEQGGTESTISCSRPEWEGRHPPAESLEDSDFGESLLHSLAQGQGLSVRPIPGEWLGGTDGRRFRILEDLGQGGMGLVLRAWDEVLHRTVALKFLAPQSGRSRASLLRREALAVARLDHENIVRLLDLSEWCVAPPDDRVPFLVMECLEGEPLDLRLRRGPLEVRRALDILCAVAAGLGHAHARQVIHRDLKPGNVFVTRDGRVKLLDFGLARLAALGIASASSRPFAGTPAYMAPEQWRGLPQDARTDIWAAGVLLFEMLAGSRPFTAGTREELRARILSAAPVPSVREHRPELPEAVERILARALAREPRRRYPSVEALREHVEALARRLDSRREASADAAQHRQVTLVACQLAGLDSRLGPGDVNELVDAFQKTCQHLLQRHGGGVTMGMGGELVACFGHPVTHEDDSEQAVRAGLKLAEELAPELRGKLPHLPRVELAVRVGIHTDQVVVEGPLEDARAVTTLSGEAPKLAAWLASEALPGTVLLSQSTQALVRGVFEMQPLGSRAFAGLARTVDLTVYRLGQEKKTGSRFERARMGGALTPLVGRESELQVLRDFWSRARQGQGALVLVRGEAGIGKSRLLQELSARAALEPDSCWSAQCWRQSSNSALLPFIEMLHQLLRLTGGETSEMKRERLAARLGASGLSSEHAELLGLLLSPQVSDATLLMRLTSDERKARTREAITALLLRLAEEHPVLLLLEDLQWADHSSLELLGFLLERISTSRLLILASARTCFSSPWPPGSRFHTVELERLSAAHTEVVVREGARGRALPGEVVHYLVEKAEGVPLFIEELTRMVLERDPREGSLLAPAIPASLHELLLARLDVLSPRQKALAQLCAVVGRSVTRELLAPLSEEKDETRLEHALSELREVGVLQREPSESTLESRYRFRHALIQDAAYQSLLRSTRRCLHGRVARLLEERFPQVVETQPERLAHHYTEAGEPATAIRFWLRAGESANERSAYVEATGHLRQGLALLESLPDVHTRIQEELRLRIPMGLALVEHEGYGAPETEQTQVRFLELLRQVDAAGLPTDVSYWSPFIYFYERGWLPAGRELASRLFEAGRSLCNEELLGHGVRMMAFALLRQGELTAAEAASEQALGLYTKQCASASRATGRKRYAVVSLAAVHAGAAAIHSISGHPEQAREHERNAVRLAEESGHPHTQVYAWTYAALTHQLRREAGGALVWAHKANSLARLHGFRDWRCWARALEAWALAGLGQPRKGHRHLLVCLRGWHNAAVRGFLPSLYAMLADILLKLDSSDEGMAAVRTGLEWVCRNDEHFIEAELYRLQGELLRKAAREAEAGPWFHRALELAQRQRARTLELRAAVSLGRQLQAVGRPGEARSVLEQSSAGLDLGFDTPDFQEARALLSALH